MKYKNIKNITLLYVEDDKQTSAQLIEMLQLYLKEVYHAKDGEEGLALYKKHQPDIILTDISMPIMDGLSMCKLILDMNPSVQIIISSAYNKINYLHKAIELGIHYYLTKPTYIDKILASIFAIVENTLMAKELLKSRKILEQYKYIVDKNAIVSKTDRNGNITYANEAFCQLSGYTQEELIGNNHNIIRHPDTPNELFKNLWETILSKKEWHGIVKNRAKDGSFYFVDSNIIPILDQNNDIKELISLRKDVTQEELQKREVQHELEIKKDTIRENKNFINEYENALHNHTLFCRTNIDGIISTASRSFIELLETDPNIRGKYCFDFLDETEDKIKLQKHIKDSIEHSISWNGVVKYKTASKKLLYLNSSFIPIMGIKGTIEEVLCFYTDMTDAISLHHEIINTQSEIIHTMGAIGETRSQETGAHVIRVAEYSKLLALKYGFSLEEAQEIKLASPMHDIGKVGIADSILNKPGKLSTAEFEVMKTHAQIGFNMLSGSKQGLLKTASIISLTHHEKWDGTGYPKGLKAEEIHIYGRITAIADVFDALGHSRVYKKAWSLERILEHFKNASAKHFDPHLLNLFFENLDDFLKIKESFTDSTEAVQYAL